MPEPMHLGAGIAVFHGAKAVLITNSIINRAYVRVIDSYQRETAGRATYFQLRGLGEQILCGAMRRLRLGSQLGCFLSMKLSDQDAS